MLYKWLDFAKYIEKKSFKNFAPLTKSRNGSPIPHNFFLLHYDNIMKHPAKFK